MRSLSYEGEIKVVAESLEVFGRYLRRFVRPLGIKVNVELALKIEATQQKIMGEARTFIDKIWSQGLTLSDLLARLSQEGALARYIVEVSHDMGERVDAGEAEGVLAKALEGDMNVNGAKSALLAFQAIARAYAEKYRDSVGIVDFEGPYCPLCGSESDVMVRIDSLNRMVCPLCGYEWTVSRGLMRCPYCGNDNQLKIGVFTDNERRYGIAYCQECGSSWKVIIDPELASAPRSLIPLLALAAERLRKVAENAIAGATKGTSDEQVSNVSGQGGLHEGEQEANGQESQGADDTRA